MLSDHHSTEITGTAGQRIRSGRAELRADRVSERAQSVPNANKTDAPAPHSHPGFMGDICGTGRPATLESPCLGLGAPAKAE